MFANVSFFLVLVALASAGLASPRADHDDDSSEEHQHHGGDKHNHHHGGKEHKHEKGDEDHKHHGGGGHGGHGGHGDVKLDPDSPFMKVKNLYEALYTELFVIANGDNYASPEVSTDVHVKARTIVLLSQYLKEMLYVYPLIFNVTSAYALKGAPVDGKETMTDLINDLAVQVKSPLFDKVKSGVTEWFIARGKYFKSGATPQEKAGAYDKWMYDPFVGAAAMNKLFYSALWKNDKPPYRLLRAMVDYARRDETEKLQNMYTAATAKTIEKVCPAHESHKAAILFYQNLNDVIAADASLMVALYNHREMIPMMFDKPF